MRLHRASALSLFLFAMVMDGLTDKVRQKSPWILMFAVDFEICKESNEQIEEILERLRYAGEKRNGSQ